MNLNIYRGLTSAIWITLKIDDNTRLIRQLLGEDIIKSSFNSHIYLDINIGDFIVYDGVIYYVNSLPNIKKNSTNSYDYNITFESESYELLKTQFLDSDGNSDFYLVGNLETFIDLIVTNMGREHTGWVKGTCDQTNADYKLLSFSKNNCMQVLQKLCSEFEGEFYFEFALDYEEGAELPYLPAGDAVIGYKPAAEAEYSYKPAVFTINSYTKDICFTDKAGSDSGYTFLYKQGLRNIHRNTLSEKNIITRLYAFGATKNLASDYRDHSRRLIFVSDGKSYLEKNIDKYGTIEHTEIFNDIYPHREGTISSINGADITKFTDSGMDFNLNDYLLSGVTAKLHFNSGNLGGYEFEVSAYNNSTKEFTIIAYKDEQGYELPNATLKPAIGDKYVLLDIFLPQSYIDTAETALQAKAQAYINDNSEPRVTYILNPDPRYFKTHLIDLEAGDFITIQDTVLGIDVMTRIVELTKSVADEYKYTLKLTDHLEAQLIQRLYDNQEDLKEKIEIGEGGDIIRSRRNWRTSEELRVMVFDTDGYFDMGNIRPESIETSMLSVGAKSTQFILRNVEIEANYNSDVSQFHASAGELIHLSIDPDAIRTWTISENTQISLVNATSYYIYAKCTKDPGYTGQIIVDETQRKFDDDPTYYYFLIGVLHSVVDSVRGISLTYGQTIINGKFIKTGKIESTNGSTYFDLDNNLLVIASGAGTIAGTNITSIENNADVTGDHEGDLPSKATWDGKTKVFRQATEPASGMVTGDIWIDTDDGDKPRTYNGSSWILAYTIIDGGYLTTGSITADKYNELRNTYVFNGDDSLDASYPFELDFEIVSEMTAIESVKLSFRISQFRAYSTGAASGGGATSGAAGTPSGGGSTTGYTGTPSGGGATSAGGKNGSAPILGVTAGSSVTNVGDENISGKLATAWTPHTFSTSVHVHDTPNHTHPNHYHSTPNHTHPNHTHTTPNHTHNLTFGIYEDSQSPTFHYHIDNGAGYGAASANYTTDQLGIDITASISGTGFKRIRFDSNVRCRIRAWVMVKIDLSA